MKNLIFKIILEKFEKIKKTDFQNYLENFEKKTKKNDFQNYLENFEKIKKHCFSKFLGFFFSNFQINFWENRSIFVKKP